MTEHDMGKFTDISHFESGRQLTYGECCSPAMSISDPADAARYFEAYVSYLMREHGISRENANAGAMMGIGYFAGYFSPEVGERVLRLFNAPHPFKPPDAP